MLAVSQISAVTSWLAYLFKIIIILAPITAFIVSILISVENKWKHFNRKVNWKQIHKPYVRLTLNNNNNKKTDSEFANLFK